MKSKVIVVASTYSRGHNGICPTYLGFDFVKLVDGRRYKRLKRRAKLEARRICERHRSVR